MHLPLSMLALCHYIGCMSTGYEDMQHFLLSAAARTLSLKTVFRMGEDKAYSVFCSLRWSDTNGAPVCPRCGSLDAYTITSRRNQVR